MASLEAFPVKNARDVSAIRLHEQSQSAAGEVFRLASGFPR